MQPLKPVLAGLVFVLTLSSCLSFYTEEAPVKLFSVHWGASRFNLSESDFRTSLQNGQDESSHATKEEILNGYPTLQLVLNPGGCADFLFPVSGGQQNFFLTPGRKDGDYCDKATVNVDVSSVDGKKTSFLCFSPDDDCSTKVCFNDISSVSPSGDISSQENLNVKLCTSSSDSNQANLWEIAFSVYNDSSKLEVQFEESAKVRLRQLVAEPDFNRQLTIVSVVGGRGNGKSTVCSLLSGNSSMFEMGSGSVGTTTTGADISSVFPLQDWINTLSQNIEHPFEGAPADNLPMFIIDSEGMGVRGDLYDFITTAPPAIIAKVIIWIGKINLAPAELLSQIKNYLNGLANIHMDGTKRASEKPFGHFVIVINRMMGDATDEELYNELLTIEPGEGADVQDRNSVRRKMKSYFDGITVLGLPDLVIPEGESLGYQHLNQRFRDGIATLANQIIERVSEPHIVSLAGQQMELVASESVSIIETLIEEANKGEIDLEGLDTFWSYKTKVVLEMLHEDEQSFVVISSYCSKEESGFSCSSCVCSFRNMLLADILTRYDAYLEEAKNEAMERFGADISQKIEDFKQKSIEPWRLENSCQKEAGTDSFLCDEQKIGGEIVNPGQVTTFNCNTVFLCGLTTLNLQSLVVNADQMFIYQNAQFTNVPAPKATNGLEGSQTGKDGGNGEKGTKSPDIKITVKQLLQGSSTKLNYISKGGEGGNGGTGKVGTAGSENDFVPKVCQELIRWPGSSWWQGDKWSCDHVCCNNCNVCEFEKNYWKDIDTKLSCGTIGFRGGDGGDGGPSGAFETSDIIAALTTHTSVGGMGGRGGIGGAGVHIIRKYTCKEHCEQFGNCNGWFGCDCDQTLDCYNKNDLKIAERYDQNCPGDNGADGRPGRS